MNPSSRSPFIVTVSFLVALTPQTPREQPQVAPTCFIRADLKVRGYGQGAPREECSSSPSCREMALEAAARGEYEAFHDLAWRAMQTGPKSDPDLMYLLARAQSLSGRPHDALVTIRRLAAMGVVTDASTNEDFRRTRALAGWPEVEALIEQARVAGARQPDGGPKPVATPSAPTVATPSASPVATFGEAMRVVGPRFVPGGLAYDAVSRRFLIGNMLDRKVVVVGEGLDHSFSLSGTAAGFFDVMAIEIDSSRGDLWVVSTEVAKATGTPVSALHKLQLISGRLTQVFQPPGDAPSRFIDVAVTPGGIVYVLDDAGTRLLRARPRTSALQRVMGLGGIAATSLAPAGEGVIYVAHADGLMRVDVPTKTSVVVRAGHGIDLGRLERIRWHRRSLVGIQAQQDGSRRVIRVRLAPNGRTGVAQEILDATLPRPDSGTASAALLGDDFFYLVPRRLPGGTDLIEAVVRHVRLR